jgi:hypothetical protein
MRGGETFIKASKQSGVITQFKCMSSVIFLSHADITKKFKGINTSIEKIYDTSKSKVWSFNEEPNITNMPMQMLHVCLSIGVPIATIMKLSNIYMNSFYNIAAVESNSGDFIQDEVLEPLPPGAKPGERGTVTNTNAPAPHGIYKKHTTESNTGRPVAVTADSDGTIIATAK